VPVHPGTTSRRPTARAVARRAALGTAAASLAVVGLPVPASAAPPSTPFVSEIHYDNAGADTGEFVEVQLPAGTSSAGLTVVLYNGGTGNTYDIDALPAVSAPADAPAVAVLDYPTDGLQNGAPDGLALVAGDGTVLEFLSYEGTMTAANGPAAGSTSTDIGQSETGTTPVGSSLARTSDPLVWAAPAPATKGVLNGGATEEPEEPTASCEVAPSHQIGAVQGGGDATFSQLAAEIVTSKQFRYRREGPESTSVQAASKTTKPEGGL